MKLRKCENEKMELQCLRRQAGREKKQMRSKAPVPSKASWRGEGECRARKSFFDRPFVWAWKKEKRGRKRAMEGFLYILHTCAVRLAVLLSACESMGRIKVVSYATIVGVMLEGSLM